MKSKKLSRSEQVLLLTVLVGMASVVALSRTIDIKRPPVESGVEEESLYVTAATANRLSLSFKGLVADWYWMRSLQYVGRKIMALDDQVELDNLNNLNFKLLPPLLDATTTLDPEFMEAYQYAAMVLPGFNVDEAIRILKRGIEKNPTKWRLYHNLGYIYWKQENFKAASDAYTEGAKLPGAPAWMLAMKARMEDAGGSRDTAREIYRRMYEDSSEAQVKDMAQKRLMQLDAFDDRDELRKVLNAYKATNGRCPASWREIESLTRGLKVTRDASGTPLDPAGTAYLLNTNKCEAEVDWRSEVPFK